jgi:RNA recognition motif-containing protein
MQIFVGNLVYTTTEPELRQWFEVYGVVASVHIPDDPVMGRSRGYGFVDMPDATAAQAAIDALNETMRGGRTIYVSEARSREERTRPQRPRQERRPRE